MLPKIRTSKATVHPTNEEPARGLASCAEPEGTQSRTVVDNKPKHASEAKAIIRRPDTRKQRKEEEAEVLSEEDTLWAAMSFAWWKKGGPKTYLSALWQPTLKLEEALDELLLLEEQLEKMSNKLRVSSLHVIMFSLNRSRFPSPLAQAVFDCLENAVCREDEFLKPRTIKAMQMTLRKLHDAAETWTYLGPLEAPREYMWKVDAGNGQIAIVHEHQKNIKNSFGWWLGRATSGAPAPGPDARKMFKQGVFTPFEEIETAHRLLFSFTIVTYFTFTLSKTLQACIWNEHDPWREAQDNPHSAEAFESMLKAHHIDLDDRQALMGADWPLRDITADKEAIPFLLLKDLKAVNWQAETLSEADKQLWRWNFTFQKKHSGVIGEGFQDVLSNRFAMLLHPIRKEAVFIKGIQNLKMKVQHQGLALLVAIGVAAGQLLANFITTKYLLD